MSSATNIDTLTYSSRRQRLTITYHGGSVWFYYFVTKEMYAKVIESKSVVSAVHNLIRKSSIVGVRDVKS